MKPRNRSLSFFNLVSCLMPDVQHLSPPESFFRHRKPNQRKFRKRQRQQRSSGF